MEKMCQDGFLCYRFTPTPHHYHHYHRPPQKNFLLEATSGFRKEARAPESVSTALSINGVPNNTECILFATSLMLNAVETDFRALASFLKPEVWNVLSKIF